MFKAIVSGLAKRLHHRERGQSLIIVLVLLMIGGLTLPPLLSYTATSLKSGQIYDSHTDELYAADSGVEDAIWQIKYDRMTVLFTDPVYDIYDFDNTWSYELDEPVNGIVPSISIQNIWIPSNIPYLSASESREIIESNKLMVAGTAIDESHYKIKIDFTPAEGEEDSLLIDSIGIWLPLGFTYVVGSGNLEADDEDEYYAVPTITDHAGGQAIVWEFDDPVPFTDFPGVDSEDLPQMTEITFEYSGGQVDITPAAIAWMDTSGVSDVPISWDIDTRIYRVVSIAGDTEIEAYSAKCELRKMGAAIAGDYRAVGNSLMQDNSWPYDKRDTLLSESDATIDDIPETADVIAAYLYWSGWFREGETTTIFSDTVSNFDNWDRNDSANETRAPTGDGDTSGTWNTSPRWDDVDETTPNDADYMTGTTDSGGYQLFTFSAFTIPADSPIADITVYIRAKDVSSGTNDIRPSIKVNGTRYNTTASSNNPGDSFTTYSYSYTTNPNTGLAWTVADINGTGSNPLQQFGVYSSDLNPDVQVSMVYAVVHVSCWNITSGDFLGFGSGTATTAQRTLTLINSLDLSSYDPGTVSVSWDQDESGYLESGDILYFAVSNDGGESWSSDIEAFHDDNPSSPYSYTVPDEYLTSEFKIRFYVYFSDGAENALLDNIKIMETIFTPDTSVVFKINDTQVYLDAEGDPQTGSEEITAGESPTLENQPGQYSYACHRDVTKLVKAYSDLGSGENHTGNGEYTVGNVDADTGEYWSYAGWAL
ncbi:MAG: hypothetical protein PHU08_05770, partial [Dehalococcoidales bacterium]|nr:hypothetical protein [Dehalococcoidales bacterium]